MGLDGACKDILIILTFVKQHLNLQRKRVPRNKRKMASCVALSSTITCGWAAKNVAGDINAARKYLKEKVQKTP